MMLLIRYWKPLIIALSVAFIAWKLYDAGQEHERAKHDAQRVEDADKARQIERDAAPCDSDPKCVQPDPFRVRRVPSDPR